MKLDATDLKLLDTLQQNCSLSVADMAGRVGLSVTPCWRRIQRMEEAGVIQRRVALLDGDKVGAGVTVFVSVRTNEHNDKWLKTFAEEVSIMPEVVEFYRMSGDVDYLLRVVVADMKHYDAFYKKLIGKVQLSDVSSSFAMEQIKYTTALPLPGSEEKKQSG